MRARTSFHFHYASGFATQSLAHMLDSLVRVSRRDDWRHSVSISNRHKRREGRGSIRSRGTASCPPLRLNPAPPVPCQKRLRLPPYGCLGRWNGIYLRFNPPMQPRGPHLRHLPEIILPLHPPMLTHPPLKCSTPRPRCGPTGRWPRWTTHPKQNPGTQKGR